MAKKILVVGSGGREHAIVRSLSESPSVGTLLCSPGNAGTASVSECTNVAVEGNTALVALAVSESVDLVVVGPEAPLADGLVDALSQAGIPAFGPAAAPARLESSKAFAKDFMERHGVATAAYSRHSDPESARKAVGEFGYPVVIKADGLAAGKGVLICADQEEALAAVDSVMVSRDFGSAGDEIVIEECLVGWETSVIGIVDKSGECFLSFLPARDHKRAGEGDTGLNTGGMGVIAPHPLVDESVADDIRRNIIDPTMAGLREDQLAYAGFLFIGIMVTTDGAKTLEYNVRFGDPEAQALLPLLAGDLNSYLEAALDGTLADVEPQWNGGASCCIVLASEGYPGSYPKGRIINGMEDAEAEGCLVYCAGVGINDNHQPVSTGGRVLGVTALGESLEEARTKAYAAADKISFDGGWLRRDIGSK